MLTLILVVVLFVAAIFLYFAIKANGPEHKGRAILAGGGLSALAVVVLIFASIVIVHPSNVGVVTVFGKIQPETLPSGLHFVGPIAKVHQVYTGVHVVSIEKTEAGSKDLQSVHASLTVNMHPDSARVRDLYAVNVGLTYASIIVPPATVEVFKAVVAQYTAEELITRRQEVSEQIHRALSAKLQGYFLTVQSIQLTNFGFSKSFDAAIEEKVTATQKAATAERNLVRVKFEADARITQAKGEAEAIRIQAEAVAKSGGEEYVKLKAVEKWDGKLPGYVTSGAPLPFINAK
jgi:prohibitin 2